MAVVVRVRGGKAHLEMQTIIAEGGSIQYHNEAEDIRFNQGPKKVLVLRERSEPKHKSVAGDNFLFSGDKCER